MEHGSRGRPLMCWKPIWTLFFFCVCNCAPMERAKFLKGNSTIKFVLLLLKQPIDKSIFANSLFGLLVKVTYGTRLTFWST